MRGRNDGAGLSDVLAVRERSCGRLETGDCCAERRRVLRQVRRAEFLDATTNDGADPREIGAPVGRGRGESGSRAGAPGEGEGGSLAPPLAARLGWPRVSPPSRPARRRPAGIRGPGDSRRVRPRLGHQLVLSRTVELCDLDSDGVGVLVFREAPLQALSAGCGDTGRHSLLGSPAGDPRGGVCIAGAPAGECRGARRSAGGAPGEGSRGRAQAFAIKERPGGWADFLHVDARRVGLRAHGRLSGRGCGR